ncbi:HNH endonuclease [Brevibacterium luteolum]|nr:HNH endonuclease [Brevibacterium luteolum]
MDVPTLTRRTHRDDPAFDELSDFSAALTTIELTHRSIDSYLLAQLKNLFELFLQRISADSPDSHAEQLAAVRELVTPSLSTAPTERKTVNTRRRAAYEWIDSLIPATSLIHAAQLLDVTPIEIGNRVRSAALGMICLPQATEKAAKQLLSFERYAHATRRARSLDTSVLPEYDDGLVRIRASDMAAFKRAVRQLVARLSTRESQTKHIRQRRGVSFHYDPHGEATMVARGPSPGIALLEARLTGVARAVITGNTSSLGIVNAGELADDRSLRELIFDFLANSLPAGSVTVSADEGASTSPGESGPARATGDPPTADSLTVPAANPSGIDIDATAENYSRHYREVGITCPTEPEWLKRQARVTITVPALTLLGDSPGTESGTGHNSGDRSTVGVPGTVNGAPVAPDIARQLVGSGHSTVYRLLTDPVSGVVLDHAAEKYTIPDPLRTALIEKWQFCTLPGCDRSAVKAELDHIIPFNHSDPREGGPTAMQNLHPLCRQHHQMKTERKISVTRDSLTGMLHWRLPGGVTTTSEPPSHPINQAHAEALTLA